MPHLVRVNARSSVSKLRLPDKFIQLLYLEKNIGKRLVLAGDVSGPRNQLMDAYRTCIEVHSR